LQHLCWPNNGRMCSAMKSTRCARRCRLGRR